MVRKPFICGVEGLVLTKQEQSFFRTHTPVGLIIFDRNIQSKDQLSDLVGSVKTCLDHQKLLVLIDQEGGRVQRLKPPLFENLPPAAHYVSLYKNNPAQAIETIYKVGRHMAQELLSFGINVNCVPVLDVPIASAHGIIGDRAYGPTIDGIVALAGAFAKGHIDGGVLPVVKHIPGHGRACVDSHEDLPIVETSLELLIASDFKPFRQLNHLPLAMTAHVQYNAVDDTQTATTSPKLVQEIIRGHIGFDGMIMSDDLSMKALHGTMAQKTVQTIEAGVDLILHCNGNHSEMVDVAENISSLSAKQVQRFDQLFDLIATPKPSKAGSIADILGGTAV